MNRRNFLHCLCVGCAIHAVLPFPLLAASPTTYSTIHVEDMHCADCAKKIAGKLYAVAGVKEVRAEVAKNMAYVVPQANKQLSPKAIWEAVERAGFKPVRLDCPDASYKTKPKA